MRIARRSLPDPFAIMSTTCFSRVIRIVSTLMLLAADAMGPRDSVTMHDGKTQVWTNAVVDAPDQLRQRAVWAEPDLRAR